MQKKNIFTAQEFNQRREKVINKIKENFPEQKGIILYFAGFEQSGIKFKQESSFVYFAGVNEPGCVLLNNLENHSTLFVPNSGTTRSIWVANSIDPLNFKVDELSLNEVKYLGSPSSNYEFYPFFSLQEYKDLLSLIDSTIKSGGKIFTLNPNNQYQYFEQRFILERINKFLPNFLNSVVDISNIVAEIRRSKSIQEIEYLYKAVDITIMGHEGAIGIIEPGKFEYEVQAGIEYVFKANNAEIAFPSIVGSGKNSTVLHYTQNNKQLKKDDLVVVDIGAEYNHYCGDLTRTYPVSGKFSKRQKEIYNIVLDTQEYIEGIAKPGMWLSNKDNQDHSLNHLSKKYLKDVGYDKYFPHGLGHFLGLDVHDVGDYSQPLRVGDIFTIEPGIYIPDENIGVRIEDNYWMTQEGVVCLSQHLPKYANEIEDLIQEKKIGSE